LESLRSGWRLFVGSLLLFAVATNLPIVLGYGPGASLAALVTVVAYRRIERTTGRLYVEPHTGLQQRPLYYEHF
jgi:hypothetical protein